MFLSICVGLIAELETGATGTGGLGTPSAGLEAAFESLQEYCNGMTTAGRWPFATVFHVI